MTPSLKHLLTVASVATLSLSLSAQPEARPAPPASSGPVPTPGQVPGAATPATLTTAPLTVSNPNENVGPILLRDESIDQVLALLERWTGKTILRPQALPATALTLTLKGGITREEAVRALESLLTLNGVAVTPLDDKTVVVSPIANAKWQAPEFIDGSTLDLPPSGRVVSKIFQLTFLRVGEIIPQISPLLNPAAGSPPVIFDKANAAYVTDSLLTLQRIENLIKRLDQPLLAGLQPKFYSLRGGAKASDVVNKMRTILSGPLQNQIGSATSFNPDDRTNQIVLIADPRQYPFFDELIAKLDVKSDPNTRNEVIYLKHATSKDVAGILSQLVTGQNAASAKVLGQEGSRPQTGNQPPAPNTPQPVAQPTIASVAASIGANVDATNQFSSLLTILSEERSNSIVVSGTMDDIRLIKELVDKIDVLLAQVRIEVVIAEVTLGDDSTTGIQQLGLTITNDKLAGGTLSSGDSGAGIDASATVTYPGVVGAGAYDLSGLITLKTTPRKNNTTILSQPTIMTTHNKEGKIFVGESRPVISSYLNDTASTGTVAGGYRSTVGQQEIGIDLSVKPLIGNDGSVQLEIKQEVNDVLGEIIIDGNPQPRIGKRTTESFVSVRSGEIVVLGGLQRKTKSKTTSRLGPIPIIGDLFGARSRKDERTDLVFFLRPMVLTNTPADNASTIGRIQQFPKQQRDDVMNAIKTTPDAPTVPQN